MKAIAIALLLVSMKPTCIRVHVHDAKLGDFWYWVEIHRTTKHGICAGMEGAGDRWIIEEPVGVNTHTGVSLKTYVEEFHSRSDAEEWAEFRCPSVTKAWKEITR